MQELNLTNPHALNGGVRTQPGLTDYNFWVGLTRSLRGGTMNRPLFLQPILSTTPPHYIFKLINYGKPIINPN